MAFNGGIWGEEEGGEEEGEEDQKKESNQKWVRPHLAGHLKG